MLKVLICLVCGLALAAVMLQLRQQKLELAHQCHQLHSKIEQTQIKLWNQQLQIAIYTSPSAIKQTVEQHDLTLVPSQPYVPADPSQDPDAE